MKEYSQEEKQLILSTTKTPGWKYVEEMIQNEIFSLLLPKEVSKNKRFEDIAIETLGKAYAVEKIESILKYISTIKTPLVSEKKDWR